LIAGPATGEGEDMPTDAALLKEVPFFQLMDEQERTALAGVLDVVQVPASGLVFSYGDPGGSLYIIRAGAVEIFITDDTGQRIVLETATAGDYFGEISLLDGGPRTASVVATEDLEALRLDRPDLELFLNRYPSAALDMLTVMGRRLRSSAEQLRHTASRNVNEAMEDRRTVVQKMADWIAEFSGSMAFLALNALVFLVWIVANVDLVPGLHAFDPFPFGLLTMAVSLEAIFLSIFVLISQNRMAAKDRVRADIEYDVNLKAELEVAELHEKVDHLQADVLARLARIERLVSRAPA
jgi:CRP/FNR family cyclic AMP-dependent transcriptional regulator